MGERRALRFGPATPGRLLAVALLALAGCNPMASWTNNQSGKSFYRAGRYAEAREEFRRAVADSPRNPDYVHNYATASRQAGDTAAAEQAYKQALFLDPSHQPSYHGLAVTLKNTGRTAEAHTLLSNWVATQPYSEKAYIEMAWLQREMGDYTGAERSLAQALKIKPGHPLALANLGQLYEDTGRTQLAYAAYQRSLATDWNQPQVASRMTQLRNAGTAGTVVAIAPLTPVVAAIPGSSTTSVAALPGQPVTSTPAAGNDGRLASNPFQPTPGQSWNGTPFQPNSNLPLASQPFRPNPNLPMASQPFQPNPNLPLASSPFRSSQAFLNVPTATPTPGGSSLFTPSGTLWHAPGPTASPYVRQPR